MPNNKILIQKLSIVITLILLCGGTVYYLHCSNTNNNSKTTINSLIAHGAGAIDGKIYTNSQEAILESLKKGYKYIELDFQLTSDNQLVCMHSSDDFRKMTNLPDSVAITYDNFKKQLLYGKYTPLTAKDVVSLMHKKSFTLVTDKISDPDIISKHFSKYKEKMLVPAFTFDDYIKLKEQGFTPMLQLYYNGIKRSYILSCIHYHGIIEWISTSAFTQSDIENFRILKRLFGVKIAVFSPTPELFKENIGKEIDLIYIDDKDAVL